MKPFDWQFPYPSQRMPILARNCVATSQPLAAQAGLRMLMKGGSAVDAVLATAISLTVLEPTSNGIGSDAFAILWDGKKLQGLNASGRSPAAWTPDRFKGLNAMPQRGWDSVTVPGAISAWVELSSNMASCRSLICLSRRSTMRRADTWCRLPSRACGRSSCPS